MTGHPGNRLAVRQVTKHVQIFEEEEKNGTYPGTLNPVIRVE
jgi:hypothetical protein